MKQIEEQAVRNAARSFSGLFDETEAAAVAKRIAAWENVIRHCPRTLSDAVEITFGREMAAARVAAYRSLDHHLALHPATAANHLKLRRFVDREAAEIAADPGRLRTALAEYPTVDHRRVRSWNTAPLAMRAPG